MLKGEDGNWHMFVEEIVNNCGLNTYARNMRIAHAVSSTGSPAGPFLPKNLVTNYSASTPHAARDPATGDWLVFATGCGRAVCLAVGPCSGGVTPSVPSAVLASNSPCEAVVWHPIRPMARQNKRV